MKFTSAMIGMSAVSAMTYQKPRRLDTTLLRFVPDEADIARDDANVALRFDNLKYEDFDD